MAPASRGNDTLANLVALAAGFAVLLAIFQMYYAADDLRITRVTTGTTPVTIIRRQAGVAAPVVVIAHGFAGSQQLMRPFAETLARNGYTAVTFDFMGHGRNPVPIRGDITGDTAVTRLLLDEFARVVDFSRKLASSNGQLVVLGHSMASDIVVRFAQSHPTIAATVAVSLFSPAVTATSPRNLLIIDGAWEPKALIDEGLRIVNMVAGGNAEPGKTYGDFSEWTARRLVLARGVEHIGVLYSHDSMSAAVAWFNGALGRQSPGEVDQRGYWLGLLLLGVMALAWRGAAFLPRLAPGPVGLSASWGTLSVVALGPMLATPLLLWKAPTDFMPLLLGDYLTLHFLLYSAITVALMAAVARRDEAPVPRAPGIWKPLALATLAIVAYDALAFGLPLDSYVMSFVPIPARLPLIAAVACGTIPYFLADEWLTRGAAAKRGAYALTKLCFLLSLALAIALSLKKLFFLIIITPVILLLFLIFGLISHWAYRATNHPLPGALANALIFAWAIAVTFPMVVR